MERVVLGGVQNQGVAGARHRPDGRNHTCRRGARVETGVGNAVEGGALARVPGDGRTLDALHRPAHVVIERASCLDHADAEQVRQRPAGNVVGLVGRTLGKLSEVRVILDREELADEVGEGLIHGDDPGAVLVADPVVHDAGRQLVYLDAIEGEPPEHLHRRHRIALLLGDEETVGRLLPELLDDVASCLVAVVEDVVLVLGCEIEHRERRRQHVVDRIGQMPPAAGPGAGVERLGPQVAAARRKVLHRVQAGRTPVRQRGLGEERRHVVEVVGVVQEAGVPVVEARPHVRSAHLAALLERLCHRHAHQVDGPPHQRMYVARDRLGERRDPDARRKRRRLVVVVEKLRLPLAHDPGDRPRLDHVDHVAVAVVVVADVLLVELRQPGDLERRSEVLLIPIGDHVLAVGVDREPEHQDHVVEDRRDLRIVIAGDQVVGELDGVLGVGHLGGVQPAVDVDERLPFLRELPRLIVGQALRMREPLGDLAVPLDVA